MKASRLLVFNTIFLLAVTLATAVDLCAQEKSGGNGLLDRVAVKTNLLYDLLVTPNLGVEIALDKECRYSLTANWMYAWWNNDQIKWYHRVNGGDLGVRRWFGKKSQENRFSGWHAGVYGQTLTYDFAWGKRGYIAEKYSFAVGAEGGYSMPIGKRLNLDFTLGAGFMWGEYQEYLPMDDCYVWQATKLRRWIGPTKAEVQLVWILGGR